MINYKSLNRDILNPVTKSNRRKALEIILFGGIPSNKSVQNILESVNQQSFEFLQIQSKILSHPQTFGEIYNMLKDFGKGAIPVIIAVVIRNNLDLAVVEKSGNELDLSVDLLEEIELDPDLYTLKIAQKDEKIYRYNELFHGKGKLESNIFKSAVNAMQEWFFGLDKYSQISKSKYLGNGKLCSLDNNLILFKSSLQEIQFNPYWYLTERLTTILDKSSLEDFKSSIDNTLSELKETLQKDVEAIFSQNLNEWYKCLPQNAKKRIYKDGEESFLEFCKNDTYRIEDLSKLLTGLSIENWEDDTPLLFYSRLKEIKQIVETQGVKEFTKGYKIIFIDKSGNQIEKIFDIEENENKETIRLLEKDIETVFEDFSQSMRTSTKIHAMLSVIFKEMRPYS